MRTAVDTPVLLDVLGADPAFGAASREALREAWNEGDLTACDVVWAELRAHFGSDEELSRALGTLGIRFDPVSPEAAEAAGRLWRAHRRAAGGRARVVADFLVGAHALVQADALLTRDRGFYRSAFRRLRVVDPSRRR